MKLNPSKTGKGAKLWEKYVAAERSAEHAQGKGYSSAEIALAWRKATELYAAWRKVEGLPEEEEE